MTSRSVVFGARHRRRAGVLVTFAVAALALAAPATTLAAGLQIATDPFTQATCHASSTTNHHANVEPDSFSNGSTIVATYQVGRIYDGGACAIGFSTSTNNGATWTSGLLPGLTKYTGGGHFDRATDAAVAYDAQAQRLDDLVARADRGGRCRGRRDLHQPLDRRRLDLGNPGHSPRTAG